MTAQEVVTIVAGIGLLLLQLVALAKAWHLGVIATRFRRSSRKSRRVIAKKVDHVTELVNGSHEATLRELAEAKELIAALQVRLAQDEQRGPKGPRGK